MGFNKIKEGINLNVITTDKFKTICIGVLIRTKLNKNYVTFNAMLPNLLLNGCEKYKTIREINLKTEQMHGSSFYADILKKGDNQILEFLIEFPNNIDDKTEIFKFLTDVILNPLANMGSFKREYFNRARALAIDKIKSRENDKKEYAKNRCIEEMFKQEEFGILADGYISDFEENKITEESLYNHYKKIIKESEIDIIAIGDILEEELKNFINKYFIIEGRDYKKFTTHFEQKDKQEPKYIEEKFNITQGKLCMGYRTGVEAHSELFLPLIVGNEILGGGSSSKLFNNVREKESLCYYINSFIFMFKGVVFVQAGVDFNQVKKVIDYIQEEIENIKNGKFSDEDIKNAAINLEKKYLSTVDYNTSVMDYYYTNFLADIKMDINETIKAIKMVKKDDILKAFSNIWLDTTYFMKGE